MAAMLELECPECDALLELDAGFAGGVCRCSNCGVLMTVPADAANERAERLSRPSEPGARPEAPGEQPADGDTYVTETGRVVRLGGAGAIPTASARKRAIIRSTTAVLFIGAVLGIVVLAVVAMVVIMQPPPDPGVRQAELLPLQQFSYDRDQNPWLLDKPNVLGMSLGDDAVIVLDASGYSADWLDVAKDAIATGVTRADSGAQIGLLVATASGVEALHGSQRPISALSEERITGFLQPINAGGSPDLRDAIEAAIAQDPKLILLVYGRRVDNDQVRMTTGLLAGQPDIALDVLAIQREDLALNRLAEDTGGRAVFITQRRLHDWADEAAASR